MQPITLEEAAALYGAADSVHDFDHIRRVLALAERIATAEGAERVIVRTAALLHDWGRAEADATGRNHAAVAAERAAALLRERGASPDFIAAVTHAIAAHRFRTLPEPRTLEAKVLFDADKLDAIGAIGIARAYAYGGAHRQRLWAPLTEVEATVGDEAGVTYAEHTPVHEFIGKLARIRERLTTATGRAIAEERHRFMVAFFRRLEAEVNGEL